MWLKHSLSLQQRGSENALKPPWIIYNDVGSTLLCQYIDLATEKAQTGMIGYSSWIFQDYP